MHYGQAYLRKNFHVNYTVDNNYTVIYPPEEFEQSLSLAGNIEVGILGFIFAVGAPLSIYAFIQTFRAYMANGNRHKTPVLLLRIHLNIADLLTLYIFVPRQIIWMTIYQWHGGVLLCKICAFFSTFCFYLNAFVICCIAVQRLISATKLNVINTFQANMRRVKIMLWISYACAVLVSIPQLIIWQITMPYPKFTQCAPIWSIMAHETSIAYFSDLIPIWLQDRVSQKMDSLKLIEALYNYVHLIAIYWFPVICIAVSYSHLIHLLTKNMRRIERETEELTTLVATKVVGPTNRMATDPIGLNICATCPVHNSHIYHTLALSESSTPSNVPSIVCCCNEQPRTEEEQETGSTPITSSEGMELIPLKTIIRDEEEDEEVNDTVVKMKEEVKEAKDEEEKKEIVVGEIKLEGDDVQEKPDGFELNGRSIPCHVHAPPPPQPKRISPAVITIQRARKRAMSQATLILVAYVTFWSPYQIMSVFNTYWTDEDRHKSYLNVLNAIICANTIANPLIYSIKGPPKLCDSRDALLFRGAVYCHPSCFSPQATCCKSGGESQPLCQPAALSWHCRICKQRLFGEMVWITTDGEYRPWYARRAFPVFCMPCLPAYMGVWPAKKCVFILGAVLFFIGVMILLAMLLTCIAVECSGIAAGLIPLGLILIIVGILLFHCGWAAHLLDDRGQMPITKKTVTTTTTTYNVDPESEEAERRLMETAARPDLPDIKQGYWQFEDKESWQAAANPYPIQSTLKYCLDRPPY